MNVATTPQKIPLQDYARLGGLACATGAEEARGFCHAERRCYTRRRKQDRYDITPDGKVTFNMSVCLTKYHAIMMTPLLN